MRREPRPTARRGRGASGRSRVSQPQAGSKAPSGPRLVYVLSDSTGNLPRHMLTAFLTQFPPGAFEVRARSFLDSPPKLQAAFAEVAAAPGLVMHALVDAAAKQFVARECERLGLQQCDLTGHFVEFLARASGIAPVPDVRRLHDVDAAYRRRVKAVEFALEHDDGLGLDTLHEADVVLVGVSRTSKTPTCMYLAQQGYKAGNYALAMQSEPPAQLLALPRQKVAAVLIDPSQLAMIRTKRNIEWRQRDTDYNALDVVEAEVQWSRRLFARQGWATFDVTNQAIEETAAKIVERLGLSKTAAPGAAPA